MKFTFRQFSNHGLKTVGTVNGDWNDFADEAIKVWIADCSDDMEMYPLGSLVETMMENTSSDNDLPYESLKWQDYVDCVSDSILHTNAPFIYNGNNKQITSYHKKAYSRILDIATQQCAAYFDNEETVVTKEVKTKVLKTNVTKTKAKYPGVYATPTKKQPNRWTAYYRNDMKTIKIGNFSSQEEAIEAKKIIIAKL
jgi:hypothetical protein